MATSIVGLESWVKLVGAFVSLLYLREVMVRRIEHFQASEETGASGDTVSSWKTFTGRHALVGRSNLTRAKKRPSLLYALKGSRYPASMN